MSCPSVLVVEDEPIVAMLIARIALEAGYALCGTAASGPEALAIAETRPPDVALIDLRLIGRMGGLEVASRLHRQFGTLAVLITADAPTLSLDRMPFPCLAIIDKPFSHERLEDVLLTARTEITGKPEPAEAAR